MNKKQKAALLSSDSYSTSADKFEHFLSQPSISSVCLYAEYNTGLITIKQKKRSSNSTSTVMTNFEEDLGDDTETPIMFAKSMEGTVKSNLTNTSTGLILLLALWTSRQKDTIVGPVQKRGEGRIIIVRIYLLGFFDIISYPLI